MDIIVFYVEQFYILLTVQHNTRLVLVLEWVISIVNTLQSVDPLLLPTTLFYSIMNKYSLYKNLFCLESRLIKLFILYRLIYFVYTNLLSVYYYIL